jgi:hypothetical protein
MAGHGRRVLLLDWGDMGEARQPLSVAGHVEQILLPLMERLPSPPDMAVIAWAAPWPPQPRSWAPRAAWR